MANNISSSQLDRMVSARENAEAIGRGTFNTDALPQPMPGVLHPGSASMPMHMPMPAHKSFNTTHMVPQHQGGASNTQMMPGSEFQFPNPAGPSFAGPPPYYPIPFPGYPDPPQPTFIVPSQGWDATTGQYYPPVRLYHPMAHSQLSYPPEANMRPSMASYPPGQTFNQQQTGHYGHLDPLAQPFYQDATKNVPTLLHNGSTSASALLPGTQPESEPATIYTAAPNEFDQVDLKSQSSDLESYDGTPPVDPTVDHDNTGTVIHHKSKGHRRLPSDWQVPDESHAPASGSSAVPIALPVFPQELEGLFSTHLSSTVSGTSQVGNKKKKATRNNYNKIKKKTAQPGSSSVAVDDTPATHDTQIDAHVSNQAGTPTRVKAKPKKPKKDKGKGVAKDIDQEDSSVPAEVARPLADWPSDTVSTTSPFVFGGEADHEFEMPPQMGYRANAGGSLAVGRNRKKRAHVKNIFDPMPKDDVATPVVQVESAASENEPEDKAAVPLEAALPIFVVPAPMIDASSPSTVEFLLHTSPPSSVVEQGNEGSDTTNEATTEAQDGNTAAPVPGWPNGIFPFPEGPSRYLSLRNTPIPRTTENYLQVITFDPTSSSRPFVSHAHRSSEHSVTTSEYGNHQTGHQLCDPIET